MKKTLHQRILSALLALCMTIGLMVPVFAATEPSVSTYGAFMEQLPALEGYAAEYAAMNSGKDANELVLNFIRTGVERYNDGNWVTLAGPEVTAFVEYVQAQDTANGTSAMALRNIVISNFKLPNGNQVDFGHMFGTMNIAYVTTTASADLGGWAGDLCDLLRYCKYDCLVAGSSVDAMAAYIQEYCIGVDADQAFGMDDFYGDLDAFYLDAEVKKGGTLSDLMDAYFTADLSDADRAAYFMNNRFKGLQTREDVREAVLNAYTSNVGISVLEADRGLSGEKDLRTACCYAFADFLFDLAGDRLEGDTGDDEGGSDDSGDTEDKNKFYSVYSSTSSDLAPGISQTINYAYTTDNKQIAYYVASVDVTRKDVSVFANYKDNDPSKGWGMSRVKDQMLAAQNRHGDPDSEHYIENYTVVAGVNGDFYNMSTGKPSGALVMEGVTYNASTSRPFFAMLKDGTPVIGNGSDWNTYADNVQEAVGGSAVVVKDGQIVATDNSRASRSAVGITADGQVILMVLDGRQEPFSAGGSLQEVAQIMIDAGCVTAMNLDGGGSSTFVSKAAGSDELSVVNSPSDGYPRSVSSSLLVVSTAVVSKEFDHANITTDYSYVTPYTGLTLNAIGVSSSGHAAAIPENAFWQVSDESVGYIEDGVFYGCAELTEEEREQTVEVQLVADGKVVGSKTIHVVLPDELVFADSRMTAIFGQPTTVKINAFYNGNPVVYNEMDIYVFAENGGEVVGYDFIGDESSGLRVATVYAALLPYGDVIISTKIQMYREDEAFFDFDNLTGGNRQFGWIRDITNSYTYDDVTYLIKDAAGSMELSYVFGLDMESIEIPLQLADLTHMLPGADAEDASAWNFLLQLAERVSVLTTVQVTAKFDMDLDVDISGLTFANEYFYMKEAKLDEATNTLTITCGWYDQTAAIDPATANPVCILSGIKATPKSANWINDQMTVTNLGDVKYDIYLRANALYSFAQSAENQEKYGLYPFNNPDVIISGDTEKGAYFSSTYATFSDSFILNKSNLNGWFSTGSNLYYYVDNKVIAAGIHKLPSFEDASKELYYHIESDGSCSGVVNGLFELADGLHYAIAGEEKTGWHTITNAGVTSYYYFDPATGAAADGAQTIGGYNYIFTDHILTQGHLVKTSGGTRYHWAGQWLTQAWFEYQGKMAYARSNGYLCTGLQKRDYIDGNRYYFFFDNDGFWMRDLNGFYDYEGSTYLVEDGLMVEYPGLVLIDGYYYYFNSKHVMMKDCTYWISKNNGYMPNQRYTFDAEGKMVVETEDGDPDAPVKNGIVREADGELYYYVNGIKTYAGLIKIDGYFYYVDSSCKVKHDCTYWISKNNGYMPNYYYTFDSEGRMVLEDEEPEEPDAEVKNGLVWEDDGELYYYVNGVKTYAGLIEIDGYYYYINTACKAKRDCTYWISKNNGLMTNGYYTFDAEGKMVREDTSKDGLVWEDDGELYYYVKGVKTYAGLIKIDGYYYYINTACMAKRSCTYWITKTNGLMDRGDYTFDDQGRMILENEEPEVPTEPTEPEVPVEPEVPAVKNGLYWEDGERYYYVNDVKTYAGLIELDGEYYYVDSSCKVKRNCNYWISKTNGLLVAGYYDFDNEGKLIREDATKNGLHWEDDGELYYYENGIKTYAGLIYVDGYYYYINSKCQAVRSRTYKTTKNNGMLTVDFYTFDDQGRIVF